MATPYEIRDSTGQYAVTWNGPAPDGTLLPSQYAIFTARKSSTTQLLPRGLDLTPRNGPGQFFDEPMNPSWYWRSRTVLVSLGTLIESGTSRGHLIYSDIIPVRYLHDPWVSFDSENLGSVNTEEDGPTATLTLEYAARSGVDEDGYDLAPDPDATWTGVPGFGWVVQVPWTGEGYIVPANAARSDFDIAGSRDYVRMRVQFNTATATGWPQGGVSIVFRLHGNDLLWRKSPFQNQSRPNYIDFGLGDWSYARSGVFSP